MFRGKSQLSSPKFAQQKRRRFYTRLTLAVVSILIIFFSLVFDSRQPALLIDRIDVSGNQVTTTQDIQNLVNGVLDQKYIGLFSKRNILIYPDSTIQNALMQKWKRIEAVEISRTGAKAILISIVEEKPQYLWCADTNKKQDSQHCYFLNDDGYIFSEAPQFSPGVYIAFYGNLNGASVISSSTVPVLTTIDPLSATTSLNSAFSSTTDMTQARKVASVQTAVLETNPVGSFYTSAEEFHLLTTFVLGVERLGIHPLSLQRDSLDTYDLRVNDGSHIRFSVKNDQEKGVRAVKYLLDNQLVSIGNSKSPLALDYLDLRFGKNVYYKLRKKTGGLNASSSISAIPLTD